MSVLAVPRSIARSLENRPYSQSKIIWLLPYASSSGSLVKAGSSTCPGGLVPQWAPRRNEEERLRHRVCRFDLGQRAPSGNTGRGDGAIHPFEILPSLCGKCLRQVG